MADFWQRVHHPRNAWALRAVVLLVLLVLPFVTEWLGGGAWLRIITFMLLYVMLALGLNIVVGYAGLLDLGYVAFFAVGAYVYALLASPHFGVHGVHLPAWVLLPSAALVAGAFGVLLGTPTLKLRGDYLAIVTLGFGEIIRIFLNNLDTPINITNGPQGVDHIDALRFGAFSLDQTHTAFGLAVRPLYNYYYVFLLLALGTIFVSARLEHSRIGRAWIAIREDEVAAAAMGINTRNLKLLAFAMGASFGGLAGGLFAGFQGFVSPESFTLLESVMILCMVVLGGMGHISGVLLGVALLVLLPEALRYTGEAQMAVLGRVVVDPSDLRLLLFGMALVLVMLLRPSGLWPSPLHKRELAPAREKDAA